jgi:hypothetical protein
MLTTISRNKRAAAIFALYAALWLILTDWTVTARQGQGDACARGMLMYPALLALAGSLLYCFVLLLFVVFNEGNRRLYLLLSVLVMAVPGMLILAGLI